MMPIWAYNDNVRDVGAISIAIAMTECVYCNSPLETPRSESNDEGDGEEIFRIRCCPVCGWWTKFQSIYWRHQVGDQYFLSYETQYGAIGSLRELDLSDQSIPMMEIRAYLAARYDARFDIDPWKFEETVASVYKDLGFKTRVTARSGDNGIDAILDGPNDSVIGIQVKRHKDKIKVEQIRSLAGALLLNGLTRGIFVTTSSFQSGATSTVERFRLRGMPIELIDAQRFYEALGLAQRKRYRSTSDPAAAFLHAPMIIIKEDER